MLYRVDQRGVVYFDVIEDAKLFEACMDYLTTLGLAYETEEAAVAAWREARAAET